MKTGRIAELLDMRPVARRDAQVTALRHTPPVVKCPLPLDKGEDEPKPLQSAKRKDPPQALAIISGPGRSSHILPDDAQLGVVRKGKVVSVDDIMAKAANGHQPKKKGSAARRGKGKATKVTAPTPKKGNKQPKATAQPSKKSKKRK